MYEKRQLNIYIFFVMAASYINCITSKFKMLCISLYVFTGGQCIESKRANNTPTNPLLKTLQRPFFKYHFPAQPDVFFIIFFFTQASRQFDQEGRKKFFTLDMNNILLE